MQRIEEIRKANNLNKTFKFELTGTHLSKNRKFFETEGYEFLEVSIVPEPNNKHDKNAIAVLFENRNIGYVPRDRQKGVLKLLESGNVYSYIDEIKWRYDSDRDYEYLDVMVAVEYYFPPKE